MFWWCVSLRPAATVCFATKHDSHVSFTFFFECVCFFAFLHQYLYASTVLAGCPMKTCQPQWAKKEK